MLSAIYFLSKLFVISSAASRQPAVSIAFLLTARLLQAADVPKVDCIELMLSGR
jgi:hypothetical protein